MDYKYELVKKAELVGEVFRQHGIGYHLGKTCAANSPYEASAFPDNFPKIFSSSAKPSQTLATEPGLAPSRETVDDEAKRGGDGLCCETFGSADTKTDNHDFFYRNKMEYSLWWDNETNKISLAFHKRGSHQKIPITQSSIERPEIFAEAQRIVNDLNTAGEEARKYQSLLVRCNQNGEVSSALFENNKSHPRMKNLTDEIMGQQYSYSPNGFFQINLPVYEMALAEIKKWLGDTEKVVDMYAGVGTIGLSVARDRDLALVEIDKSAFAELVNNINVLTSSTDHRPVAEQQVSARLEKNGERVSDEPRGRACEERREDFVGRRRSNNIDAICTKSENALEYITSDITLILDPPRAGLDETVVAHILEAAPPRVIYLSCNPATQARDIAKLLNKYQIIHAQAFNFFPRTPHIENLVVLEASKP
jgi:23S rRNA (uracil1939-C5)-methyltransferase